ncbi:hypothetical protein XENOCAPTIV_007882, partial [Xenoophorus captivus]
YQMEDVAKACCDFLTKHLEPANVIGISRFAEEIGCTELHKTCRMYINSHFSENQLLSCPILSKVKLSIGNLTEVGGRNLSLQTNLDSSFLCCYNPMTNQWSQRASLNIPRNRVGVAVVDGCIYAVGGSQGSVHHNTVER